MGFIGGENAALEKDFESGGASRERQQALQLAVAHGKAELVDWHPETARLPADA
jgi:hypothetical protein